MGNHAYITTLDDICKVGSMMALAFIATTIVQQYRIWTGQFSG
jgi:hypothetical protein